MKEVLIIGSGISGMACAIRCAQNGMHATLASPFPSERAQSVMAAGGINAVMRDHAPGDSVECHVEDTLRGGACIAGKNAVEGLCGHAESILRFLESIGTVFSVDENGHPARRAFGGQSHKRTYYCGSATGKLIVSALVMEVRRYEAAGLIQRRLRSCFHSALIENGVCYGALLFDETTWNLEPVYADAVVIATGGQNALFGKTTGSTQCDGYTAGKLFLQGAELKNLEFIQYHPTTLETAHKRMLISEAARGEGGRLFYEENGGRVYFMEDKYGPNGNLMTRDVVAREIQACGREVFSPRGERFYSFPDAEELRRLTLDDLKACGLGYRAKYFYAAAQENPDMAAMAALEDDELSQRLKGFFGVGDKVSACVMLYGYHRLRSFPRDVWMNRIIDEQYGGQIDLLPYRDIAGIMQQYLFYYVRLK